MSQSRVKKARRRREFLGGQRGYMKGTDRLSLGGMIKGTVILQLLRGMYKRAELRTGVRKPSKLRCDGVVALSWAFCGSCRNRV